MTRKLHLFSGQLAVGCAGNGIAAKTVYKDIEQTFSSEYFPRNKFFEFINSLDYLGNLDLSLVGLLTDQEGSLTFRWQSSSPNQLHIDGNYSEGSGKYYFDNILSLPESKDDNLSPEVSPLIAALKKCVLLYGDEQIKSDPLHNYFGGGFEIIGYHDGRLKRISDVAFVFWVVNFKDGRVQNISFKKNIVQCTYRDEILWICSNVFRSSNVDPRYPDKWRTELYALQPIHGNNTPEKISKIDLEDFSSKTICNYFYVNDIDNNRYYSIVDIALSENTDSMSFESSKTGIILTFKGNYYDRLNDLITNTIKNTGKSINS